MRGKFSPTLGDLYRDSNWWLKNGGGYGMLADGTDMGTVYHDYDHEGYDVWGYDASGRDRAGNTLRQYQSSDDLFPDVLAEWLARPKAAKSASDYWQALCALTEAFSERFPGLPVRDPQDVGSDGPGIHRLVSRSGSYGIALTLGTEAGFERSFSVFFDNGAGGSSRLDHEWTADIAMKSGGETRRQAICFVDDFDVIVSEVVALFANYDPERCLHDILVVEGGDGVVRLAAVARSARGVKTPGDRLASCYGSDPLSALEAYSETLPRGGPLSRMAHRGLAAYRPHPHAHPVAPAYEASRDEAAPARSPSVYPR